MIFVQVELNSLRIIDIYVNGEKESFEPETSLMEFTNLILMKQNNSALQIIFRSGISVSVTQNEISLSFEMLLPEFFKGQCQCFQISRWYAGWLTFCMCFWLSLKLYTVFHSKFPFTKTLQIFLYPVPNRNLNPPCDKICRWLVSVFQVSLCFHFWGQFSC